MFSIDLMEEMFESSIRVERIIHIGSMMVGTDEASRDVLEPLNDDFEQITDLLDLPNNTDFREPIGKLGFLIQFATPIPNFHGESVNSWSFSWSYYTTEWIYSEDIVEACKMSLKWRDDFIEKRKSFHLDNNTK